MGARGKVRRRRSAAEWEELVEEWGRSGLDDEAFAAQRGVDRRRLAWWRWRLSKGSGAKSSTPRLVRVDMEAEPQADTKTTAAPRRSWEISTTRGQLVVHEGIGSAELGAVLTALFGR
jgi:hypothetical protein